MPVLLNTLDSWGVRIRLKSETQSESELGSELALLASPSSPPLSIPLSIPFSIVFATPSPSPLPIPLPRSLPRPLPIPLPRPLLIPMLFWTMPVRGVPRHDNVCGTGIEWLMQRASAGKNRRLSSFRSNCAQEQNMYVYVLLFMYYCSVLYFSRSLFDALQE